MSDIPARLLDAPVSDTDVATIAGNLKRWEELSPFLGLTPQHEIEIRNDFKDQYREQKRQALQKWKEIKGNAATYRALIAAAAVTSSNKLVDDINAMLRTREEPTGTTT